MTEIIYSKELINEQHPEIAVVTCSDSRVCEYCETDFEFHPGEIFAVRVTGNNVKTAEGSVNYAIFHLKVKELHIIGHSNCGMIKALLKGEDEDPEIQREIDLLKEIFGKVNDVQNINELAMENVHRQIEYLLGKEKIKTLVENGELTIKGFFYDFSSGKPELKLININGERV